MMIILFHLLYFLLISIGIILPFVDTSTSSMIEEFHLKKQSPPIHNLATSKLIFTGTTNYQVGSSVSIGGDVNGDGKADMLIGCSYYNIGVGKVFLIYGGASLSDIALNSLASSQGIGITGEATGYGTGNAVSLGGDVNGDGIPDMLIGASNYNANKGKVYLIYGSTSLSDIALSSLTSSQGIKITGIASNDFTGYSVNIGGDVNGDGFGDMLIGSSSTTTISNIGKVYLIYGGSSLSDITLSSLTSSQGIVLTAPNRDYTGSTVSLGGDVNGDGKADMLIGASGNNSNTGKVYLIYGGASLSNIALGSLTSSQGIVIMGEGTNSATGYAVSMGGDVNGDGIVDLLIGAPYYATSTGKIYLIYGKTSMNNIALSSLTSNQGISITGAASGYYTGSAVSIGGDVNGDGKADILIGASNANTATGKAFVVYGGSSLSNIDLASLTSSQGIVITGELPNSYAGSEVSIGGDVNGDGMADMLIGAWGYSSGVGRAYLIFGGTSLTNLSPTFSPSRLPSRQPTSQPSSQPTGQPLSFPSIRPSSQPSMQPSMLPTCKPSAQPSTQPSQRPLAQPSSRPSTHPSSQPSNQPTKRPSSQPTMQPLMLPTCKPSAQPSTQPSQKPSALPTCCPSSVPSTNPTGQPLSNPTSQPSLIPTTTPSHFPSIQPSSCPTVQPSSFPTTRPSKYPSGKPSCSPSSNPSSCPSTQPSLCPSSLPSIFPSGIPTKSPSTRPASCPSGRPTIQPNSGPTSTPTNCPSTLPSSSPSFQPSSQPSGQPSYQPTTRPSSEPTSVPSSIPNGKPSLEPSSFPSGEPTDHPSTIPSCCPSTQPTVRPSNTPTFKPITRPSSQPSSIPSRQPSCFPSIHPSSQPSRKPTGQPSSRPSRQPSGKPSRHPSTHPSSQPSRQPTGQPSQQPSSQPSSSAPTSSPTEASVAPTPVPAPSFSFAPTTTRKPTRIPTVKPTRVPSLEPTPDPTLIPSMEPTVSPTCSPTKSLSVIPDTSRFKGSLFFFKASSAVNLANIQDIDLRSTVPDQRSFVIFGQPRNSPVFQSTMTLGSHQSLGLYAVLSASGEGGLCRDTVIRSVTNVGDINGDGFEDLVEGYPDASICLVYLGSGSGWRNMVVSFSIVGDGGTGLGWSVAGMGDWNQDGLDDLVICGKEGLGVCCMIYGRAAFPSLLDVAELNGNDGFRIEGGASILSLGMAVAGAKDFNGDGFRDLVVSAMDASIWQSVVYVVFGPLLAAVSNQTAVMLLDDVAWRSSVMRVVCPVNSFAGYWVAGIGDLNDDGFDDIAISSMPFRGGYLTQRTYVIFGRKPFSHSADSSNATITIDISRMVMGKDGFTIIGAGFSVSEVGDVNEDGISDLMVSSYYDWPGRSSAYLVSLPSHVSSPPTFLPTSSPSSSPSWNPTSVPSLRGTTNDPTNRPSILTHYPTLSVGLNESGQPTILTITTHRPTRAPVIQKTISPTLAPSTLIPSLTPSFTPSVLPTAQPYRNTTAPTFPVRRTRPPRTISPTRPLDTFAPTSYVTVSNSDSSLTVDYLATAGDYIGTAGNQNFVITGPGVYHIDLRSTETNGGDVKVFSFVPINNEVWIEGFDTYSDILDLSKYTNIKSLDDLSYSTNPLRIFLSDSSSMSTVSSDSSYSSFQTFEKSSSSSDTNSATIRQQSIIISNRIDLHSFSSKNFIFAAHVVNSTTTHLEGLIAFGMIVFGSAIAALFATFKKDDNEKDDEKYLDDVADNNQWNDNDEEELGNQKKNYDEEQNIPVNDRHSFDDQLQVEIVVLNQEGGNMVVDISPNRPVDSHSSIEDLSGGSNESSSSSDSGSYDSASDENADDFDFSKELLSQMIIPSSHDSQPLDDKKEENDDDDDVDGLSLSALFSDESEFDELKPSSFPLQCPVEEEPERVVIDSSQFLMTAVEATDDSDIDDISLSSLFSAMESDS